LPALAARPVWSAPVWLDNSARPYAVDLGETVAVARDDIDRTTASPGGETRRQRASVLDFREIAGGRVRATVKLPAPLKDMSRDTLHGRPVVVVGYDRVTPSDGLSAEKRVKVLEVYDGTGTKVGHAEAEGTFTTFAVVEGRVVRTPRAGAVSLTPLEGGSSTTVECGMPVCGFEATNGTGGMTVNDGGGGRVRALLGDLAFTIERPSAVAQGSRLLAVDAATGQRRWTSSTIQAPTGARGEDDATGVRASPIALVGGKLVLAWSGPGVNDRILALHDPATGKLVSTGPRLPAFPYIFLTDAKGETAVASSTASDARSVAWDLAAGKVFWEQAADEKALEPFAVINGAVYGHITKGGSSDQTIVVDLRTKKVLVPALDFHGSLTPTSTGYGLVVRGETMYVFPAA
jgi:hypothetical protein